jgi:DNA-binding transcriptional LysR family regulator
MKFKRIITSSSLEVITALVAANGGVGILPALVANRVKNQGIQPLLKEGPIFKDSHCLVYRADAQRSKASRDIAKFIETHLVV